jgi:hypothetical protein
MEAIRSSLLIRAQAGDAGAWQDLCELYCPLIVGWLHRQAVPAGEVDDLVQEIFGSLGEISGENAVRAATKAGSLPSRAR